MRRNGFAAAAAAGVAAVTLWSMSMGAGIYGASLENPAAGQSASSLLHPFVVQHQMSDGEEESDPDNYSYTEYARMDYAVVSLNEEEAARYPALAEGLQTYFAEEEERCRSLFQEMLQQSAEDYRNRKEEGDGNEDYWEPYREENFANIVRADETALSIRFDYLSFTGGVHGYQTRHGVSFDTKTGAHLSFADVISDTDAAAEHVMEKLGVLYPDLVPSMSAEEIAAAFQGDESRQYVFDWTLEPEGVMVYFGPNSLGSYADGMQAVLLPCREYPEIYNENYCVEPDRYIIPMDSVCGTQADLGDGQTSCLYAYGTPNEYGQNESRTIFVNGLAYVFDEDLYFYGSSCYLVKKDGRAWLWCIDSGDNDYQELRIYGFENGKPEAVDFSEGLSPHFASYTWAEMGEGYENAVSYGVLTDPDRMQLDTRIQALSTYAGYKTYRLSGAGTPISDDLWYQTDSGIVLNLLQPCSFTMVGQDGTGTGEETFPAGTQCTILRTDGRSFTDLVLDGNADQIGRLYCDYSVWPRMYGDIEEYDLFENMMYAG